jgi:hypothetical protein
MLKVLAFALALHVATINGLILRTQKSSDSTAQFEKTDALSAATATIEAYKAMSKEAPAEAQNKYFFDFVKCMSSMPYNEYMSYEGVSFCRINAYSCNNLWPEELHTEVVEGTFCLINAFEYNEPIAEVEQSRHMYQELVISLNKYYIQAMEKTAYRYYDAFASNGSSAPVISAEQQHPPPDTVVADTVGGGIAAQSTGDAISTADGHANDASHPPHSMMESCTAPSSDKLKVKCMIQNMKIRMSEIKDSKPDYSNLTPNQTHSLLKSMQDLSRHVSFIEEAKYVSNEMVHNPSMATGTLPDNVDTLVPKPFKTSLGKWFYKTSAMQGHVGGISANHRFAWEHVQPGLGMTAFELTTIDPLAVCNDGSSALMFLGPAVYPTKWHLHIDGGYFCFDKQTCLGRALFSPGLVSTKGWENQKNISGMFDPKMGGFEDYTHGAIQYCSSDAWFGQIETEEFTMVGGTVLPNGKIGTYFRGYTIVQTALKKFLSMGMGNSAGQELFMSGCSAGSIAATAQADSWDSRLRILAGEINVPYSTPKIWTLLDGAPVVSPPAIHKSYGESIGLVEMASKLVAMLYGNPSGPSPDAFLNKDCVAAHSSNPGDCVWTATVLPYIKTPNIVLAQFWDNFVDGEIYGFFIPTTTKTYSMGMDVVHLTRETMKTVSPFQNYWTIGCGDHCLSSNPYWWRLSPASAPGDDAYVTAKEMTLWTRAGTLGRVIADTCDSYNCGCVGQGSAYNKLAAIALFFQVLNQMTPWDSKALPNLPTPIVTAIAGSQTNNPFQLMMP